MQINEPTKEPFKGLKKYKCRSENQTLGYNSNPNICIMGWNFSFRLILGFSWDSRIYTLTKHNFSIRCQ